MAKTWSDWSENSHSEKTQNLHFISPPSPVSYLLRKESGEGGNMGGSFSFPNSPNQAPLWGEPKTRDKKKRAEDTGILREWKGSVAKMYIFYLKETNVI